MKNQITIKQAAHKATKKLFTAESFYSLFHPIEALTVITVIHIFANLHANQLWSAIVEKIHKETRKITRNDALKTLANVLSGNGHYECFFADGSTRNLSWTELHNELKRSDPQAYATVKYRWINDALDDFEKK